MQNMSTAEEVDKTKPLNAEAVASPDENLDAAVEPVTDDSVTPWDAGENIDYNKLVRLTDDSCRHGLV